MEKDWEQAYKEGDTPWDKGHAAPPLREFLAHTRVSGRVLVPGCGRGHDVRLLAEQGADVVGMDISEEALRLAETFDTVRCESYELADYLNPPASAAGAYDWVFEHTCLCAIPVEARSAYVAALLKVLKPKGQFLAVFFRAVRDYDGDGPPHPIEAAEIDSLFGQDFERVQSFVPTEHYPERPFGCEEVVHFRRKSDASN